MTPSPPLAQLRRVPLFDGLSDAALAEVAGPAVTRTVERHELLFSEGDPAVVLPVLLSGQVKLSRVAQDGREQVLHLIRGPASFAEAAVFGPGVFPATAEVLRRGELLTLPRAGLLELLRRRPELAIAMLGSMAVWLRRLTDLVEGLSLHTVEERLGGYLLSVFVRSGAPLVAGMSVELTEPKHLIAAQCGTGPEVLSRTFRRLEREGIAQVNGPSVTLLDPAALVALAGVPGR